VDHGHAKTAINYGGKMSEDTKFVLVLIGFVILFVLLFPWVLKYEYMYSDWVMR